MPKVFGLRRSATPVVESYWPIWVRRIFESLREIPWLSLTAIGTLLGVLILVSYFHSIDHFPLDFSALLGLGVATAVGATGLTLILAVGLFLPAAMYRDYAHDDAGANSATKRPFTEIELIGLQLGGVGFVFTLVAYLEYRDCGRLLTWSSLIAASTLLCWLTVCFRVMSGSGARKQLIGRFNVCVGIAISSSTLCLVFVPMLPIFVSESLDSSVMLFLLWALAIIANAFAAKNLSIAGLVLVGGLIVGVFFIAMPAVAMKESVFPKEVATLLGVRQDKVLDLRVPDKTCRLIQSAIGTSASSAGLKCVADDWGTVNGQILSNVGDQWLFELAVNSTSDPRKTSKLRLTVPKAEIQIVRHIDDKSTDSKKMSCKLWY